MRTRSFEVMVGPVLASTDEGVEVVVPAYRVAVRGAQVKYHADYFQVIDVHAVVVFAIPHNLVMWCREDRDGNSATELNLVPGADLGDDTIEE